MLLGFSMASPGRAITQVRKSKSKSPRAIGIEFSDNWYLITSELPLTMTSRAKHTLPTSPRSTGFCAIWDCISSSSSSTARVCKWLTRQRPELTMALMASGPGGAFVGAPGALISH